MIVAPYADQCPAAFYCPEGTADPIPCPEGSYSPTPGLLAESQCLNCTGGYFCNETGRGYMYTLDMVFLNSHLFVNINIIFCRKKTIIVKLLKWVCCTSLKDQYMTRTWIYHGHWQCLQFCDVMVTGLLAVVGKCQPGYYCPSGSKVTTEVICTAGHYCGEGTQDPTPCSNGTFSNVTGLTAGSECWNCTPGYYCNGQGLTAVSGPCKEGTHPFYTITGESR